MKTLLSRLVEEERFLLTRDAECTLDMLSPKMQSELETEVPATILESGIRITKLYLEGR